MIDTSIISIFYRFTVYSFIGAIYVYIYKEYLPILFIETIQALCLFVATSTIYIYTFHGYLTIQNFYLNFVPGFTPKWFTYILDITFHFLPLLLIGLPSKSIALFIAYTILVLWYTLVRSKINTLYMDHLSILEYDTIIWIYNLVICIAYALIISYV